MRRHRRAGIGEQALLEFDQRRLDALIAMRRERRHQALDDARLEVRFGRQHVAQACGEQGALGEFSHRSRPEAVLSGRPW
jgi:hypothetical protein